MINTAKPLKMFQKFYREKRRPSSSSCPKIWKMHWISWKIPNPQQVGNWSAPPLHRQNAR